VYDSRDWLGSFQNPLGKITYLYNDAAHRLIASTDTLNRTTTFGYDDDGRQTTNTDAALEQTVQIFDARGNLVCVLDAATNVVGRAYDGAGNLTFLTNRNANVWKFRYDGANRLTNTISPLTRTGSQVYNNRGLLQSSTDPMLHTTSFGYDARGRMTSKSDNMGVNNYQYDGNNNLTLLTNVGTGTKLLWAFDANNRTTSFTNAAGYVIQYRYDANGNVTNLIYPGNRTVQYFYDSNNHLTNMMDWAGRQTTYAYDLAGRLTGIIRPNNTLRSMGYDDAGQLTNVVERQTSQYPIAFYTLHYDLAGRSDWEFKGPLPHPFTPATRNMTYDADDRLATFNGTNVTVDADGNLTFGPLTNSTFGSYTYDARNELTGAGGVTYGYDPAGNRTFLTNGLAVTSFVINPQGSQMLMRIKNGTTNYYVYGAAGLAYEVDETSTTTNTAFYHFDVRGSTIALTDKSGNLTDQIEYSPYGSTTFRAGSTDTPFGYNGQFGVQTDPNGLLFMRARYYNPYISRFLNPDPSAFNGGLNFYAFCNGNPISDTDPFGLGEWYDRWGASVGQWVSTAQTYYNNNLPWVVSGTLNTGISIVGNVLSTPQALGHLGEGSGTFSANPSWSTAPGLLSDVAVTAGTLAGGLSPIAAFNTPLGYGNVVYRYASEGEVNAMNQINGGSSILNTDAAGAAKNVYVTPDAPYSTVGEAESSLQIGAENPNGATASPSYIIAGDASGVDFSYRGQVAGGSGTEWITSQQIPVISVNPIGYNLYYGTAAAGLSYTGAGAGHNNSTGKP
jgi:RHS repeat-associated protein